MVYAIFYIKKLIRKADLFGQPIMLNFKNKIQYQTIFGGFTSILSICFVSFLFFQQAMQLINKENYNIVQEATLNFEPPSITINQRKFVFAINVMDSETGGYKTFFDLQLFLKSYIKNPKTKVVEESITIIPLVSCTPAHFADLGGDSIQRDFGLYNMQGYKCPPLNFQYELQGFYNNDIFKFLKIQVIPCSSTDPNKQCETQNILDKYIEEKQYFLFQFISTRYQIHPTQKNLYKVFMFDDIYFPFTPGKVYTRADIFLKKYQLSEDESILPFITQETTVELIQAVQEDIKDFQVLTDNMDVFGEYFVRLSTESIEIKKSYQRIDDYLAYVGGILKFILSLVGILVINYNKFDLDITIANRLFNFEAQDSSGQGSYDAVKSKINDMIHMIKVKLKRQSLNKEPNPQNEMYLDLINKMQMMEGRKQNNNSDKLANFSTKFKPTSKNSFYQKQAAQIHFQENFLNQCFNEIISCKQEVTLKFKYLVSRWTFRIFCYDKDQEIQQIDTAVKIVKKEFDVLKILDRLQTVDRLKELFFNPDQINFLEHLQKPIVKTKNIKVEKKIKKKKRSQLYNQDTYQQMLSFEKLFNSYGKIVKAPENIPKYEAQLNRKLLAMVDNELKTLFNFCAILPKSPLKTQARKIKPINSEPNIIPDLSINGQQSFGDQQDNDEEMIHPMDEESKDSKLENASLDEPIPSKIYFQTNQQSLKQQNQILSINNDGQ